MATKPWMLLSLSVAVICVLAGCDSSTFNVQNPPPPPPSKVSIAFAPAPPTGISIAPNPLPTLSATVSNDPNNYGVDWVLAVCQSDGSKCDTQLCVGSTSCGNLYLSSDNNKASVTHAASGDSLTYQPPPKFLTPGNIMVLEILAFATADHTKNVLAPVKITAFGSVLQAGTYVFNAHGNSGGTPYQIAGAITLDGNGNITAGQQTLNTISGGSVTVNSTQPNPDVPQTSCSSNLASCNYFFGSSYFVGADGRGSMILGNMDQQGTLVSESFSLEVLSSSKALIAELDTNSSVGTLELQNPNAAATLPSGGYAFVAAGADTSLNPIGYGGVLNIDSPGSISGKFSQAVQDYYNVGSTICPNPKGLAGSTVSLVSNSPVPGTVVFSLVTNCNSIPFVATQLAGYIVDSTHIRLIETDDAALTDGLAIAQASAPGSFGVGSFSGPYLFGVLGIAPLSSFPSSFTSVGVVCPDGGSGLDSCTGASGGFTDTLFVADNYCIPILGAPCPISAELSGNYQIDSKGIGLINLTHLKYNPQPVPTHPIHPVIDFFLTGGPGAPALVLYQGGKDKWFPAIGAGIAYPQASSLSFGNAERYGVSFTQQNGSENEGTGWMTANLPSTAALPSCFSELGITSPNLLAGCADDFTNGGITAAAPIAINDSFCPPGVTSCSPDSFGRYSNMSTFLGFGSTYYLIDQDHGFFIETDQTSSSQVGLGYFAKACDVTSSTSCQQAAAKSSGEHALNKPGFHRSPRN